MARRQMWHLWGVVAGVGGIVANLVGGNRDGLSDEQVRSGVAVVPHLDRTGYHLGVVTGWIAIAALIVAAAGWQRIARRRSDEDLAWQIMPFGFIAAAGALTVGYGFKGALAEYLPGGANDDAFDANGLYTMFVINDNAPWIGWWGVVVAAGACAWLGLVRRRLPIALGILSALALLPPVAVLIGIGAAATAGITGPAWLVIASGWLALRGVGSGQAEAVET